MKKKHLLFISFFTILLIAVIHYFALQLHWYFTHRWIDIFMHILGGFWIATTYLWIYTEYTKKEIIDNKNNIFIKVCIAVVFVGTCWEIFELLSGNTFMHTSNYWTDSISDMTNNIIGGLIAIFSLVR